MKRIRSLKEILALAKKSPDQRKIVLVGADNGESLKSLKEAMGHGLVQPVLVGDKPRIVKTARSCKFALRGIEVIDQKDPKKAASAGVAMCRTGEVDILMKGSVSTDVVLRAILDRDNGLGRGGLLSNVTVFESPTEKRLLFMTDPAVNINPDVARKVEMLRNAVWVAKRLGFASVKAAVLAAIEKINPKDMPATTDAAVLARMGESGQIPGAEVDGPFALDIAVSSIAAKCKNIDSPIAGKADVLLCPEIHSANILYKALIYFAGCEVANALVGVKTPLVMTSRSDSLLTKLYTIALSAVLAGEDS